MRVFTFSNAVKEVPPRRGMAAVEAAPGPVAAAVEAWLIIHKLTGIRPDELDKVRRTLSLVTAEQGRDDNSES